MGWAGDELKEVDFGGPTTEQASDHVVGHAGGQTDTEYSVGVFGLVGDDRGLPPPGQ